MSWLLVVQPDPGQADALRQALLARVQSEVVVVESLNDALAWLDRAIPDVVLLPTLTPSLVEEYLLAYLSTLPGASHVQILGLPHLRYENVVPVQTRSLWRWRRKPPLRIVVPGRDPDAFTEDVIDYLACARAHKRELYRHGGVSLAENLERRREPRFATREVPWISLVSFAGEGAALVDVSARGALLRTSSRPTYQSLKRPDPHDRLRSHLVLRLESHSEVRAPGQIIRCVPLRASGQTQYEIAFSFDDEVGLHLPWSGELVPSLSAPRALPKQTYSGAQDDRPQYLLLTGATAHGLVTDDRHLLPAAAGARRR